MKLKIDEKSDALYLRIDESQIIDSKEITPGVIIDFNDKDQVVGIEILNLSKRAPEINYHSLQYEIA
ncbi:MAG: DUF2283 domain-containing protein [Spirochaetota bacterium]